MAVVDPNDLDSKEGVFSKRSAYKKLQNRILKNLEIHTPPLFYPKLRASRHLFSTSFFGNPLQHATLGFQYDILHLHWINWATLNIEALSKCLRPIVWTFHDLWPMTGGCHYPGDCNRFVDHCGRCPLLGSYNDRDLSSKIFERKLEAWKNLDINVIAPSKWMAREAKESKLFEKSRIETIPNGIDDAMFNPDLREPSRANLGLSPSTFCLFFAASGNGTEDPRKGFAYLSRAIEIFRQALDSYADILLLVAGAFDETRPEAPPFNKKFLGVIKDAESMAKAYAAADVFVAPSLEDNLPNTVLESLACGTPVVAFNTGGMPDMVIDGHNGRLAMHKNEASLAESITWILKHPHPIELRKAARATVMKKFTLSHQADACMKLYESLLLA